MKPSERDPGATMILAKLAQESGVPDGVLNIVHGGVDTVNFMCDAKPIKVIFYCNSRQFRLWVVTKLESTFTCEDLKMESEFKLILEVSLTAYKAKNHGVIMSDANKNQTLNALVGAAFGAAGQRCMALSTAVFVGEARKWLPELVERAKKLKVSSGFEADADLGPMITQQVF